MALPPLSIRPPVSSSVNIISHVSLHPLPLATILDHHLRRPESQDRVFGALLGTRTAETGEVEVKSSFGVPYAVTGKDIAVDSDHHRSLLELHTRISPRETIVGWYATNPTLNSFSALLQDFYTQESSPNPSLHLTLDPETLQFKTFTAQPIGLTSSLNLTFKSISNSLVVSGVDQTGIDLLTKPLLQQSRQSTSTPQSIGTLTPLTQMHTLLVQLKNMLEQMKSYVDEVVQGKREGDVHVGRYLLESVGSVPVDREAFEDDFQSHLSDVLMVSYLANLVRAQTEISGRLNLLVT